MDLFGQIQSLRMVWWKQGHIQSSSPELLPVLFGTPDNPVHFWMRWRSGQDKARACSRASIVAGWSFEDRWVILQRP
jgi:hypothetical protein